jgi:hypothetical protein
MARPRKNLLFWADVMRVITHVPTLVEAFRSIFVHGASTENKSSLQNWVTLSTTEAELVSATSCAQSLLFHYRLLTDIGLRVKLPMVLEIDNKGAKDLVCNWSVGGRIRHVNIRQYFLRDLKEDNLVKVIWIPTLENSTDLFTKNLYGPLFEKHIRIYVGADVYMTSDNVDNKGWSLVTKKGKQKEKKKTSHIRGKHQQAKGNLVAGFDPNMARGESVAGHRKYGFALGMVCTEGNIVSENSNLWNGQLEYLVNSQNYSNVDISGQRQTCNSERQQIWKVEMEGAVSCSK